MKNSPEDARYYAIEWLLEDDGFYSPEIDGEELIFRDQAQKAAVEQKGITLEDIKRYIAKKRMEKK